MKPAGFDYLRAEDTAQVLEALSAEGDDARIIAGGQSLAAMLNMRLTTPSLIIDIMNCEFAGLAEHSGALVVPFTVRQAQLQAYPGLPGAVPLLAAILPWVGHMQTRSRGTVCGSLAHADPSAELPLALVALEGRVRLRSARGRREVTAEDFFLGAMTTDLQPDEMIEAAVFPMETADVAFREVGRRRGDFAIVSCAAIRRGDVIRLTVGGVNDVPIAIEWTGLNESGLDDALNAFAWSLDARGDLHASARYRRDLVRRLGRAVIEEASACG